MSIIYLADKTVSINTQHIIRYYKFNEESDRLVTSTHKLIAELVVGNYNHVDSSYDDTHYDPRTVIFEGTEAECVARHENLMDRLGNDEKVIRYDRTVGTPLGIQEFVDSQCANVKGEVISAKQAKGLFLAYFDTHFPQNPLMVKDEDKYQHRPFGIYSDNPDAPDMHQFIKWMYSAALNAQNMQISTLYQNGYFSLFDNYDSDAVDMDQVFFANLAIKGQMESEPVPHEIMLQIVHLKEN